MSFLPVKNDTGAVQPWEYMEAGEGTYQVGQLLTVKDGKLAALEAEGLTVMPEYVCMAEKTVAEADADTMAAMLAVQRVKADAIYETTLSAEAASAKPGVKAKIAEGGLETDGAEGGAFELVAVDGTAQGDTVRGRFVPGTAAAAE